MVSDRDATNSRLLGGPETKAPLGIGVMKIFELSGPRLPLGACRRRTAPVAELMRANPFGNSKRTLHSSGGTSRER